MTKLLSVLILVICFLNIVQATDINNTLVELEKSLNALNNTSNATTPCSQPGSVKTCNVAADTIGGGLFVGRKKRDASKIEYI